MKTRNRILLGALLVLVAPVRRAPAVTSSESVASDMNGNGHNVSFDGRLYIVRDSQGWQAMMLRPEAVTYRPDGMPNAAGPMWSGRTPLLVGDNLVENALAICEADHARAPFACDAGGDPQAGGPFDCYDLWIIDSDAVTPAADGGATLRRRRLALRVASPRTASARVVDFTWGETAPLAPTLRGIEPTVTADGKLMVWQGHPANDGQIDILMYAVNDTACGLSGWSAPKVISRMAGDDRVVGSYRLAERGLRAADGTLFAAGDLVHGAYPWLMPSGDAVVFAATPMPCRGPEDPPGCGPRRNSIAVLGYPTNWGLAPVDGGVNPSTTDGVRLFFSSPGPTTFSQLPVGDGSDVWPFFGSNTSNYVELVFDDGLDGKYAGMWHGNEMVTASGELDLGRTPDVSGYYNTGVLKGGLAVSSVNDGVIGRALSFDGVDDRMEVAHSTSLSPVSGITIDLAIRPSEEPDCDGNNNYRLVLGKGNIGGAYSVVLEESRVLQIRFAVDGEERSLITPPVPLDRWTEVSCEYDGTTGAAGCWFDGEEVVRMDFAPGSLTASTEPLLVGGPGARDACPNGDGAFRGKLDEIAISRVARRLAPDVQPSPDAGPSGSTPDAGPSGGGGGSSSPDDASGSCGCAVNESSALAPLLLLALLAVTRRRRSRNK
jgi:MYXO-CTERM domain-containing protein